MRSVWAAVGAVVLLLGCGEQAPLTSGPVPRILDPGPEPSAIVDQVRILRGVEYVHDHGATWIPGDSGSVSIRAVNGPAVTDVPFTLGSPGEFLVQPPAFGRLMVSVARPRSGVPTHVVLDPTQTRVDLREIATGRPDAVFAEPGTKLRVTWSGTPSGAAATAIASPSAGLESPLFQDRLPSGTESIDLSALQAPALLPGASDQLWVTSFGGSRVVTGDRKIETTWLESAAVVDGVPSRNGAEVSLEVPFTSRPPAQTVAVALDANAFIAAASESVPNGSLGLLNVLWFAQAYRGDAPMLLDLGDLFVVDERVPPTMRIGNPFPADWPLARVTVLTVKGADGRFAYFYEADRPNPNGGTVTTPRTRPPRDLKVELTEGVPALSWTAPSIAPDYYVVHLRDAATDETLARWLTRDTSVVLAPYAFQKGRTYDVRVSAIRRTSETAAWSTPLMDAKQDLSRADAPAVQVTIP